MAFFALVTVSVQGRKLKNKLKKQLKTLTSTSSNKNNVKSIFTLFLTILIHTIRSFL